MNRSTGRRASSRALRLAGILVATIGLVAACTASRDTSGSPTTGPQPRSASSAGTTTSAPGATSTAPAKPARTVKVTALENDGQTYGVGMPIVLYFSPAPTNSAAFVKAVTVTDNGHPVDGAWYWEQPDKDEVARGIVEAHFRPKTTASANSPAAYWPADSHVHVSIPIKGLSAGTTKTNSLVYSGELTSLDYDIGDAHISIVDANSLKMTVTSNGAVKKTFPVSLGRASEPTLRGVKVVMQKGEDDPKTGKLRTDGTVLMSGNGYHDWPVQWSVRVTQSGEYVHAAPWNPNIGDRSTSDGCTNLHTADGEWFYTFSRVGDVVTYVNAPGPEMRPDDGLGDWNIPWTTWAAGGLLPNS